MDNTGKTDNKEENVSEASLVEAEYIPRDDKGKFLVGNREGFQIGNTFSTGRPKKALTLISTAEEELNISKAAKKWARQIEEGDTKARDQFFDRTMGKAVERKQIQGEVTLRVVYEGDEQR